jgi:hypothetical protein
MNGRAGVAAERQRARIPPMPCRAPSASAGGGGLCSDGPGRLGAAHCGNQPPITGTSSGSFTKLVNKTDYVKAESKPAGARLPRRLGAKGNRGGRRGAARVYRAYGSVISRS